MSKHLGLLFTLLIFGFACSQYEGPNMKRFDDPEFIQSKLKKYAPVELRVAKYELNENQLNILKHLVKAAQAIDDIFWQQSYSQSLSMRQELINSTKAVDKDYLHFLKINYGPFDRQDNENPFIGIAEKPPGAGFYPEDMTKQEFEQFVQDHPDLKDQFYLLNTIIKRENASLVAVPYEQEYRANLEVASNHLQLAAEMTSDSLFKKYLNLRADALLSGEFFNSDMVWMELVENELDIVIGPIETYEDQLLGLKASYEGIVLIRDMKETERMDKYVKSMNQLEYRLPVPRMFKKASVAQQAPIGVFNTIFTSGDANLAVKSIAFSLPNDERVRELKGARTVQEKNIILAKYEKILVPIAARVLADEILPFVDGDAFFTNTLLHELAHPLGLNYVRGKNGVTVREALKETYSPIEEAKADIVGLFNVGYFVLIGVLPSDFEQKAYVTFIASIFRSVRFGATEAHAKANMIAFNYLVNEKAILFDPATKRYNINFKRMRNAVKKLAADLLMIEGDGNYEKASQWLADLATIPTETQAIIDGLSDIPVDLEFIFDASLFE